MTTQTADVREWFRLNNLATGFEADMRAAFTRNALQGEPFSPIRFRPIVGQIVHDVCRDTAITYNLVFNSNDGIYKQTIERLLDKIMQSLNPTSTRVEVTRILPRSASILERQKIIRDSFGLDVRSALVFEKERQEAKDNQRLLSDISIRRNAAIQSRGNLIAVTEVNRAVNEALIAIYQANEPVSKSASGNEMLYGLDIPDPNKVPRSARKVILTRRDDRVCNYCDALDGEHAKLDSDFETEYGKFFSPPFHPRC